MLDWFRRAAGGRTPSPEVETSAPSPDRTRKRVGSPQHLTGLNLSEFLAENPRAVVDVWAPWCGPCRAFAPVFTAAAKEWGDRVGFGKIHADHEPSLVARFGVRSIPSLLFFRDRELVRVEVGATPPDRLARLLRRTFRDLPE